MSGNNRWNAQHADCINPADNPFLHIYQGTYIPAVGTDIQIEIARSASSARRLIEDGYDVLETMTVDLALPPAIPPQQISVRAHIECIIDDLFTENTDTIYLPKKIAAHPDANTLTLLHGDRWGNLPLERIKMHLMKLHYCFTVSHAQLNRGKRIPKYGTKFSKIR